MHRWWLVALVPCLLSCKPDSNGGRTRTQRVPLQVGEPSMGLGYQEQDPYEGDPRPHVRAHCVKQDIVHHGRLYEGMVLTKPTGLVAGDLCADGEGYSMNQVERIGVENLTCSHPKMRVRVHYEKDGTPADARCLCYPMPDILLTPVAIAHWCETTAP